MASTAHQVPFYEDANDDTGSVVEDSKVSASPKKVQPNTGKSRREKLSSRSSDSSTPQTDNDLPTPPSAPQPKKSRDSRPRESRHREKEARPPPREKERPRDPHRERDRERDRNRDADHRAERPKNTRSVTIQTPEPARRPKPILHSTAESPDAYRRPKGVIPDSPAHFGLAPGLTPSGTNRPRTNSRPSSYYGAGSRPPAANERWHTMQQGQQQNQHPFAPAPYGSSPFAQPPPPLLPPPGYHMPPSPTNDYFTPGAMGGPVGSMAGTPTQHLASRFSMQRPSSASGYRQQSQPPPPQQYDEFYDQEPFVPSGIGRRPSVSRREVEDRRQMPPPPLPMPMPLTRPMTAGPNAGGPFRPPPQMVQQPRRLTHYKYDEDELGAADPTLYREVGPSRSTSYSYGENAAPPRRIRQGSVTYDGASYQIEPATSTGRRHSYYGSSAGSVDYQDQMRQAELYQGKMAGEQMSGGQLPLTRETLDKVSRPKRSSDKSSRSTRSSASRDESDYWAASNTTRTTRSGAGDGEHSIRIVGGKGGATVRVGELEIQCPEGEIIINQDGGSTRGSDRGSTVWGDERPTPRRIANVPYRPRANSQAPSHGRSQFPGSYENYPGHI